MKLKETLIASFVVVLLGGLGWLWLSPGGGTPAPDIEMTTLDGKTLRMADLKGRPALVVFWATTCPTCVSEMPQLVELHREFADAGFAIVGITPEYDPPEQVRAMVEKKGLPYTIVVDDGSAAREFGDVKLTPTHFLIDHRGRIVQQKLGSFTHEALWSKVRELMKAARA